MRCFVPSFLNQLQERDPASRLRGRRCARIVVAFAGSGRRVRRDLTAGAPATRAVVRRRSRTIGCALGVAGFQFFLLLRRNDGVDLLPGLLAKLLDFLMLLLRGEGRIGAYRLDLRARVLLDGATLLNDSLRNPRLLPARLLVRRRTCGSEGGAAGFGACECAGHAATRNVTTPTKVRRLSEEDVGTGTSGSSKPKPTAKVANVNVAPRRALRGGGLRLFAQVG